MPNRKKLIRTGLILISGLMVAVVIVAFFLVARTRGRTVIQIDIHQNKKLIHLSNFAEPPQFAIWLENAATGKLKTIFVTHRVAKGDWEGKANVPVALPLWYDLFRKENRSTGSEDSGRKPDMAITGATPKGDYFSVRVEVEPGSQWICWIEMNLAGDYNDAYPEIDLETLREDEFGNGQPALVFRADVKAVEGLDFRPAITEQSEWKKGVVTISPVSKGVTTAKDVFDDIKISVIKPKPKLIDHTRIQDL